LPSVLIAMTAFPSFILSATYYGLRLAIPVPLAFALSAISSVMASA